MTQLRKVYSPTLIFPSKYDQISFRQKGAEIKGALYKGNAINAYNKIELGAIPSKNETIIRIVKPNKNQFNECGCREMKFLIKKDNIPGPGNYDAMPLHKNKPLSKKGFGIGFASNERRFKIINYFALQTPGPCFYQNDSYSKRKHKKTGSLSTRYNDFFPELVKSVNKTIQENDDERKAISPLQNRFLINRSQNKALDMKSNAITERRVPKSNRNSKVAKTNQRLAFEKLQLFLNADLDSKISTKTNDVRNCKSSIKSRQYGRLKLPRRYNGHFNTRNTDNNNVSLSECISNSYCRIQSKVYKIM